MVKIQISWNIVQKISKYLLSLLLVVGIGYLGYLLYYFATNTPYEVRVTNVTGTSATISWYTNREDKGVVAYRNTNRFIPIISWIGSSLGYDDRDVALAQSMLMDKLTGKAVSDVNSEYEVSLDSEKLNDVKVTKKGNYYVHHVTITNLTPESKYYFRVGNGLFFWNVNENNQKTQDFEAPAIASFEFSTYKDPETLSAPNPSYGQVLSLARNNDGYLMNNPSTDAIVFLKVDSNSDSQFQSSVVNTDGGWVIDKTNFRDSSGNIYKDLKEGDVMRAYPQFENVAPLESVQLLSGVTDNPAQNMYGNTDNQARVNGNILDKLKFSLIESDLKLIGYLTKNSIAAESSQSDCPGYVWTVKDGCTDVKKTTIPAQPSNGSGSVSLSPCIIDGKNYGNMTSADCRKKELALDTGITPPAAPALNTCSEKTCDKGFKWNNKQCACVKEASNYDDCTGQHARSCDTTPTGLLAGNTSNCYCAKPDGSYLPLVGIDCRPASCANNREINNDNECYGGNCTPRLKCPDNNPKCTDEKEMVLCGSDYTTPGCGHDYGKCPEGTIHYPYRDNCLTASSLVACNISGKVTNLLPEDCDKEKGKVGAGILDPGSGDIEQPTKVWCLITGVTKAQYIPKAQCDKSGRETTDPNVPPNPPAGSNPNADIAKGLACCSKNPYGDYVKTVEKASDCAASGLSVCSKDMSCGPNKELKRINGICQCPGGMTLNEAGNCIAVNEKNPVMTEKDGGLFCKGYNCGYKNLYAPGGNIAGKKSCGKQEYNGNCSPDQYCEYLVNDSNGKRGICKNRGVTVAIDITNDDVLNSGSYAPEDMDVYKGGYTCCKYSGDLGTDQSNYKLIQNDTWFGDCKQKINKDWQDVDVEICIDRIKSDGLGMGNEDSISKIYANNDVDIINNGDYIFSFPESGIVTIAVDNSSKNLAVNKNNKYFLFQNRDGVEGYQEPIDPNKPKSNEDLLINTTGKRVSVSKVGPVVKTSLKQGINIISFNYVPTSDGKKALTAKELIGFINNMSDTYIKSLSYFDGGKWIGGIAYNRETRLLTGNDFPLVPGRGYVIVAYKDVVAEVTGMKLLDSVPIALSSGWNLVGVNGYSKTFTASSLIDSINGLSGIKSNNVTWWPTSKGRYESFQKSEGVEYGFDYPILNDMGYFVRISEFNPEDNSTKSIIWNPGSDLNGKPGSQK